MKINTALFTLLFSVANMYAAISWGAGGPPMITDDPGTPGNGNWEINIAEVGTYTQEGSTQQIPLLDINYGYGDSIQIKAQTPWVMGGNANSNNMEQLQSGMGMGLVGIKYRFYESEDNNLEFSTYPQLSFLPPRQLSTINYTQSDKALLIPIEFLYVFNNAYDLTLEAGRWLHTNSTLNTDIIGGVITRKVSDKFELMLELHNEFSTSNSSSELIFNMGSRYYLSEQCTILLALGRDLNNTLTNKIDLLSYFGLQFHL